MAVVQFGFAIILASHIAPEFTCGTTRGTFSSYLNAEELSITFTQASTAILANTFELPHHAANNA